MKVTYLHVSYITTKGDGNFTYGDMLVNIKKNGNIKRLREYILETIKEENPKDSDKYQLPSILSMTVIKKKLYKQLVGK
jgi:hypothetical protein